MRKMIEAGITAAFTLVAETAVAATLYTPALYGANGAGNVCMVTNVSAKIRVVSVAVLGSNGAVLAASAPGPLDPGTVRFVGSSFIGAPQYCRVTVEGSRRVVRVSFEGLDADGYPGAAVSGQ
jgi:hypothetical protein